MSKSVPPEHTGPVTRLKVYPDERPKTRGDCASMPRPCPFLSCRYHLAHSWVAPFHGPGLNDDDAVEEILTAQDTCVLDVADRGEADRDQDVADALKVKRQSIADTVLRTRNRYKPESQRLADDALETIADVEPHEPFDLWSPEG